MFRTVISSSCWGYLWTLTRSSKSELYYAFLACKCMSSMISFWQRHDSADWACCLPVRDRRMCLLERLLQPWLFAKEAQAVNFHGRNVICSDEYQTAEGLQGTLVQDYAQQTICTSLLCIDLVIHSAVSLRQRPTLYHVASESIQSSCPRRD